ncbi:terminase small subunit [Scandinavium manionii]|uniref:terminase small subunit n=1 Tax=Scandinavium manionii TaxID=2926520 RepID=UPI0021666499|nr:terminase small subunit [Scandinavium manionii]MCS2168052.1 terminase small subunit [Scandinavium manionii]
MKLNKKKLADMFGVDVRTITTWQSQGLPVISGGGKGVETLFDSVNAIRWYTDRDTAIENEKLRRELEELRSANEENLQPGTIEYERYRLTKAQADAVEMENARKEALLVDTEFCTFVLGKVVGQIASILDTIPAGYQRKFPGTSTKHIDHLKGEIIRARNKAANTGEKVPQFLDEYINIAQT